MAPNEEKKRIDVDPITKEVLGDDTDNIDAKIVVGFAGDGAAEHRCRLYLSIEFDNYIEFDSSDIIASRKRSDGDNGIQHTIVWLKRDAVINQTKVRTREVQARFLRGSIADRFGTRPSGNRNPFGGPQNFGPLSILCDGTLGSFLGGTGGCAQLQGTFAISCIREFCDFIPATLLPDEVACTWEAECP